MAGHFDHAFYRRRYGVAEAADAVRDYCDTGWRQGRNPRPDFNGWAYRDAHPYVEETGIAPFVHFLATALHARRRPLGRRLRSALRHAALRGGCGADGEARLIEPYFDAALYAKRYPDARRLQRGGPLAHFRRHGQHEDRDPSKNFSIRVLRRAYGHLLAPGESPFLHYVRTGRAAGLMGCPEDLGTFPPMDGPRAAGLGRPAPRPDPSPRPASS